MELFEKYGVFNNREMHSRYEIGLEQYALTVGVEANLTARDRHDDDPARRGPLPDRELAGNVAALKAARRRGRPVAARSRSRAPLGDLRAGLAELTHGALADLHDHERIAEADLRPRRRCCRPCPRVRGRPPTRSRASSPTTCGRCRPTRRCSSSSDPDAGRA